MIIIIIIETMDMRKLANKPLEFVFSLNKYHSIEYLLIYTTVSVKRIQI